MNHSHPSSQLVRSHLFSYHLFLKSFLCYFRVFYFFLFFVLDNYFSNLLYSLIPDPGPGPIDTVRYKDFIRFYYYYSLISSLVFLFHLFTTTMIFLKFNGKNYLQFNLISLFIFTHIRHCNILH